MNNLNVGGTEVRKGDGADEFLLKISPTYND